MSFTESSKEFLQLNINKLRGLLDLHVDTDYRGCVENIRANVDFRSGNAWTLVFAIFVASIGLNTNSAAVIIGAMLISPLMGPIVGAGLGFGTNDMDLVKRSFLNLSYAVVISILVSCLYFFLSPLSELQSELLARTRPTVFDVLIAFFGGAAGIVAASRKEKSNAIPGVAIATALMPPLCTAGYGISQGNFSFFLGGIFLFLINSVYICLATLIFVRFLKFPLVDYIDQQDRHRLRNWILTVAILVLLPSIVSAWYMLKENSFENKANSFVKNEFNLDSVAVLGAELHFRLKDPKIVVRLMGDPVPEDKLEEIRNRLKFYDLPKNALVVNQSTLAQKLEERLQQKLVGRESESNGLSLKLSDLELQLRQIQERESLRSRVGDELRTILPEVGEVLGASPISVNEQMIIAISWSKRVDSNTKKRAEDFLRIRFNNSSAQINHFVKM